MHGWDGNGAWVVVGPPHGSKKKAEKGIKGRRGRRGRRGWWRAQMKKNRKGGGEEAGGGSSQRQQCKALKWAKGGHIQCTLQAMPGKIFCGNHIRKQSYGTVEDMPQVEELELQQKPKEEVFECEGHELVSVEDISKNQDIDMFLLPLPVVKIGMLFLVFLLWATYESFLRKAFKVLAALPPPPAHVFGATQRGTSSSKEGRSLQGAPLTRCRNSFAYITKPIQWQLHCKKNNQVPCCHSGSSTGGPWHWDCPCWAVWVQNPIAIISEHLQHGWRHEGRRSFRPWASRERLLLHHAYIHRILPGMVSANDPYHWGTLELRQEGRAASEVGKVPPWGPSGGERLDSWPWWMQC